MSRILRSFNVIGRAARRSMGGHGAHGHGHGKPAGRKAEFHLLLC